jgi:hypothetical protein
MAWLSLSLFQVAYDAEDGRGKLARLRCFIAARDIEGLLRARGVVFRPALGAQLALRINLRRLTADEDLADRWA